MRSVRLLLLAGLALMLAACDPTGTAPDWLPPATERAATWSEWRATKDSLFLTDESPLTDEDLAAFAGLEYFPFDSTLAFALALEPVLRRDTLRMPTTTGQVQRYIRYGRFAFHMDGRIQRLTAFRAVDRDDGEPASLFVPFTDPTNRTDSYGGGRYIELPVDPDGRYVLDFNYAYSPYCAYDERWSCPVPPAENRLSAPVRAGERYVEGERVWVASGR